jgi:hypothetical protein
LEISIVIYTKRRKKKKMMGLPGTEELEYKNLGVL